MEFSLEQLRALLDRGIPLLVMWMVGHGWITADDGTTLASVIIGIVTLSWAWWINRKKRIVQKAAEIPGTTVVTTQALANATPSNENIVSNLTNDVVPSAPR